MNEDFDLQRFVLVQEPIYDAAIDILRGGAMCTPYMDFIFPRYGSPDRPRLDEPFAIGSLDEARAYLAFPLLGNRYRECVEALSWLADRSAAEVFGDVDAGRLQASLTLFAEASGEQLLRIMLTIWFGERVDEITMIRLLAEQG